MLRVQKVRDILKAVYTAPGNREAYTERERKREKRFPDLPSSSAHLGKFWAVFSHSTQNKCCCLFVKPKFVVRMRIGSEPTKRSNRQRVRKGDGTAQTERRERERETGK